MNLRKQTLDGNMETLILAVWQDGPSYGYQIVQDLNQRGRGLLTLGEGTVYPVLHRIESRGLVAATWRQGDNGRQRKYYRLTPKGRAAQRENRRQWEALTRVMGHVLPSSPVGGESPEPEPG